MAHRRGPLTTAEVIELRLGCAYDGAAQFATAADRDDARARLAELDAEPGGYMRELMVGSVVLREARRRHDAHDGYRGPRSGLDDALDCARCNPGHYTPRWMLPQVQP
jgi:hypothetical protein